MSSTRTLYPLLRHINPWQSKSKMSSDASIMDPGMF